MNQIKQWMTQELSLTLFLNVKMPESCLKLAPAISLEIS